MKLIIIRMVVTIVIIIIIIPFYIFVSGEELGIRMVLWAGIEPHVDSSEAYSKRERHCHGN